MSSEFDGKKYTLDKETKMTILLDILRNKGVINEETYEASLEEVLRKK